MKEPMEYGLTTEDLERMADLAGMELHICTKGDALDEQQFEEAADVSYFGNAPSEDEVSQLLVELGKVAFSTPGESFAKFVYENNMRIRRAALCDERVAELLVLGYRLGISVGSNGCMNDLGALYYAGEIVEQDYVKAAELYEMAMEHGCYQSIINLGYIYEYGRTGEHDYAKAYQSYALASALETGYEAVYKLGDMYSRGKAVERNMAVAKSLWERSLDLAWKPEQEAQPAIRIAQLLINPECREWGIEPDPLRALKLFQQAEVGLRIDIIENGMLYYRKRLQEAIEGQERARELVEESGY